MPQRIFGLEPLEWLLEKGCVVICAGGGGIPVMYTDEPAPAGRRLVGVEAVIDKDFATALLAVDLKADARDHRDGRRRRLLRLGHARPACDPSRLAERARRARVRRGIDGTEGARRLHVRRTYRRHCGDRLDQRHCRPCCEARPERQWLSTRPRSRKEATMATVAPAPQRSEGGQEVVRIAGRGRRQ